MPLKGVDFDMINQWRSRYNLWKLQSVMENVEFRKSFFPPAHLYFFMKNDHICNTTERNECII
jgi:hypothetical protein